MHLAQTQIALAFLYNCYWHICDENGKSHVQSEMLRVQSTARPRRASGK